MSDDNWHAEAEAALRNLLRQRIEAERSATERFIGDTAAMLRANRANRPLLKSFLALVRELRERQEQLK